MRFSPAWLMAAGVLIFGCDAGGPYDQRAPDGDATEQQDRETGAMSDEPTRRPAAVGVGQRGANLGEGPVSTVAKAQFTAQERVALEMYIPQAMQLFKAEHGRNPGSHDEFMEQIIKANRIQLPPLPEGQTYVYDPESAELMVETAP